MKTLSKQTHFKCPDCDEMIPRGFKFMAEHWIEKHGCGFQTMTERLNKLREEKGREITGEDLVNLLREK